MTADVLAGRTIALPETRELDVFAGLLERRGATVWRCPLIAIVDAPNPEPVLAWARLLAAGGADDLILLTGEGLRRVLAIVEQHASALRPAFVAAVGKVRRITRGPKPARVLRELGLAPDIAAAEPTTAGVMAALRAIDLTGRRVALQLYGEEPNWPLRSYLAAAGATTLCVAPYRYADAAADSAVHALLEAIRAHRVDAIAFTSKAQVQRLVDLVGAEGVRGALQHCDVAVVGPVVAAALSALGIAVDAMPADSWFLKPLTSELVGLLSNTGVAGN
jgi:uroporphyrinogen-III synthase